MNQLEQEILDFLKEDSNYIDDVEEFDIIDEGDWISEGKYEFIKTIVKYKELYFQIYRSRSGSYYSEYYYNKPEVMQVEPKEETKVVITWVKKT